ncbi:MAG: four helix bundle protein [candidate division WOR-3 bacterium]|nr:MAG: four helix bundle protein [candidate division WOR-3 bacterium]
MAEEKMRNKIRSFKDLVVWQLASEFSSDIYNLVRNFPREERFSLSDNLLRAARSIPANIAEGWGRIFPKEKISFYNIANGSAEECNNHIIEAKNIGYIDKAVYDRLQKKCHVIAVKLTNLIAVTRRRTRKTAGRTLEYGEK